MNKIIKDKLPIILITSLSIFIYIWKLWDEGLSNLYYSAGVYSMGQNIHAFFYNSIDSIGFISIDKPPLGLWIQVLFTKIFGFNGVAVLLPEALAGVFSVYLIYKIIDKRFSRLAAITSSLVLACTPILAAVCRNNTMDGILIFMLVLASLQAIIAAEKSSVKHLILASVFIALGFNVKSLQAYMIVPAVYLTYFVFSKEKIIRKIIDCFISVTVLIVISLSWVIIVDLTPAQNRPYVGSSGTNSELNLTFGNNGMGRLIGGDNKNNNTPANQNNNPENQQKPPQNDGGKNNSEPAKGDGSNQPSQNNNNPPEQKDTQNQVQSLPTVNENNQSSTNNSKPPDNDGNQNQAQSAPKLSGNGGESGPTSLFRLYIVNNAGQIAWFLLPAFLSSLISLFLIIKNRLKAEQKYISLFYFSMCFLPMLIYFCFSNGVVHRYYLAMLAFPIAALIGIGLSFVEKNNTIYRSILCAVFFITAILQLYIQSLYKGWLDWLLPLCGVLFFAAFIVLILSLKFNIKKVILSSLLSVLLILPCVWSLTPIIYGNNAQLPIAGSELVRQGDAFDRHSDLTKLIAYLNENRGDASYLAAVPSAMSMGAELILQSKEPVMVLGGFNGGDNPVNVDEFKKLIADGKVKYAILANDQAGNASRQSTVLTWIEENCSKVEEDLNGITLYQL